MSVFEECLKCQLDFSHFAETYAVLPSNKPLVLEPLHKRFLTFIEGNNHGIVKKFRQGGFTTLCAMYGLWQTLFTNDKRVLLMVNSLREAKEITSMLRKTLLNLDDSITVKKFGDNFLYFNNESSIYVLPAYSYRYTEPFDLIFMDEVIYWKDLETRWKEIYSNVSPGGKIFIISTPGKKGEWFHETYKRAVIGLNSFRIFDCNYKEMSYYQDDKKLDKFKKLIGHKEFRHEYEAEFLFDKTPMEIECEILENYDTI